jgi:Domain of unknown function (DUF5615)
MALRLYADECVDRRIIAGLRRRGTDIATAADAELLGASDEQHLGHAAALGRTIVSADRDFLALVKERSGAVAGFPGLIFVVAPTAIGPVVQAIELIASILDPDEMANWIEWVP